jgi:D-glycero-D-manno-heptose 1,7-bisphosphate phosphatase
MQKHSNPAIFIDRDGTINEEVNYLDHPDRLRLLPRSVEAIKKINQQGIKTIVITNQSGIARGYFTEKSLHEIHQKLKDLLAQAGARIDDIYFCPHHPDDACDCRKPATGMLKAAAGEHAVDLRRSFVIGDKLTDVELAHRVGAKGILVLTGYGHKQEGIRTWLRY